MPQTILNHPLSQRWTKQQYPEAKKQREAPLTESVKALIFEIALIRADLRRSSAITKITDLGSKKIKKDLHDHMRPQRGSHSIPVNEKIISLTKRLDLRDSPHSIVKEMRISLV
jgi:hypothetical protein